MVLNIITIFNLFFFILALRFILISRLLKVMADNTSPVQKYFVKNRKETKAKLCIKDIASDHSNTSNHL